MDRFLILIVILSITGSYLCQDEVDFDKIKSQLPEGIIPDGLGNITLPTADQAKQIIKDKCLKVYGNESAYENAETATMQLKECITDLVNVTALQIEIEQAKPNGELDTVFNKYCRRRTIAIECLNNFTASIEPCLNEEEIANKKIFINIFVNLLNFVCHKDGDQIALFIAEKGPECFSDKKDGIIECINSTFSDYIPKETPTIDNLPQFIISTKQCIEMDNLQSCMVKHLETCEESTPANLVESAFKFIRNETPCKNHTSTARAKAQIGSGAKDIHKNTAVTFVATIFMAVIARFFI